MLSSMRRLRPTAEKVKEELRKTVNYFESNIERMRYAEFRRQGLFVGSGVIEAGCKTIVGQRLKKSVCAGVSGEQTPSLPYAVRS